VPIGEIRGFNTPPGREIFAPRKDFERLHCRWARMVVYRRNSLRFLRALLFHRNTFEQETTKETKFQEFQVCCDWEVAGLARVRQSGEFLKSCDFSDSWNDCVWRQPTGESCPSVVQTFDFFVLREDFWAARQIKPRISLRARIISRSSVAQRGPGCFAASRGARHPAQRNTPVRNTSALFREIRVLRGPFKRTS
jgi:hypothetical protein